MSTIPPTPIPIVVVMKISSTSQRWCLQQRLNLDDKCGIRPGCMVSVHYHHNTPTPSATPKSEEGIVPKPGPAATGYVKGIVGVDRQNIRFMVHIIDPSKPPYTATNPPSLSPTESPDQANPPTDVPPKPSATPTWAALTKSPAPPNLIESITLSVPHKHCKLHWGFSIFYHLVRCALPSPPPSVPIMASRKEQDTLYNLQCRKVVRDTDGLIVYEYDHEGTPRPQVEYIGGEW
ncbi:hypothetical protein BJ138DRAFT_1101355 [Hygrophoropsis aurantiaca]|uniref:Uncharacterized protein n=1 Tax=Hygrophoropsis aurantiaca TaxID=72124 RepID=A0ACB8ACL7_9AGAM|nr:hypothetical protein BJ138DRAFT_1101355 [Hygrophoropsis aurantiaca]